MNSYIRMLFSSWYDPHARVHTHTQYLISLLKYSFQRERLPGDGEASCDDWNEEDGIDDLYEDDNEDDSDSM